MSVTKQLNRIERSLEDNEDFHGAVMTHGHCDGERLRVDVADDGTSRAVGGIKELLGEDLYGNGTILPQRGELQSLVKQGRVSVYYNGIYVKRLG
jgi:hypothetical protein